MKRRTFKSRRKSTMAKIGRKTIRRARSRRRFKKAMPSLKHAVTLPVRRRFYMSFQDPHATFTVGVQRFHERDAQTSNTQVIGYSAATTHQ